MQLSFFICQLCLCPWFRAVLFVLPLFAMFFCLSFFFAFVALQFVFGWLLVLSVLVSFLLPFVLLVLSFCFFFFFPPAYVF